MRTEYFMLKNTLSELLYIKEYVKFGVILSDFDPIFDSINESISSFGVESEFFHKKFFSDDFLYPNWAGRRDFDIRRVRISLSGPLDGSKFFVYLCSLDDLWLSLFIKVSKALGVRSIVVRSSPSPSRQDTYIQEIFVMESGNILRIVRLIYDSGWKFLDTLQNENTVNKFQENRSEISRISREDIFNIIYEVCSSDLEDGFKLSSRLFNCQWDRIRLDG